MLIFILFVGRDSKMYVFRLSDFEGEVEAGTRGKTELKEHRLEKTRGCTMYATSRPGGSHLRMVSVSVSQLDIAIIYGWSGGKNSHST